MVPALESLFHFSEFLKNNASPADILSKAINVAADMTKAKNAIIALYDNISRELYYRISIDEKTREDNAFFRFEIGRGIMGWVAENRIAMRIKNAAQDSRFDARIDSPLINSDSSVLSVPMLYSGKLKGVLLVINKRSAAVFNKRDEYRLTILAGQVAAAIENNQLLEENLNQSLLSHIGQNIANSAHGIKNILNNIDGGTFIVERGVTTHKMELVDKGWEIMKRNSYRLRELVLDMLLFSRPKNPEYVLTDINNICCDVFELINEKAERENVKIELDLDYSIGPVCIDPKGVYRSILNLVSNALASFDKRESGLVKIQTKRSDDETFKIIVSDNGAGISKDNLNHIFDVFFTTKGSKGTGLGLPVTKKIISEHQGTIEVSSRINSGTVFTISMPRKK